ncbi:MAG: flavin containing amine oxidoreductase-like protein [Gammaproteobacteria bacterium]|nr:flavin containing amine oxidoreductase-like protein [Gammaproteobacteria bacterium]
MRIAVIGAGLSGLSFAHSSRLFADIHLFEKSRGVGGRLATRRAADYEFDHGAQFFTCRSKSLKSLLKGDDFQSAVSEWQPKLVTLAPDSETLKRTWFEPHYVGVPSMTAFPKRLARGLALSYSTRVREITRCGNRWQLKDGNGYELGVFDWVVSATPAPQVAMLFGARFFEHSLVEEAQMSPCIALMIALKDRPQLDFEAAIAQQSPISWLAINNSKPARSTVRFGLVVHSSNEWARAHIDEEQTAIENQLLAALNQLVDPDFLSIQEIHLQRWRYAKVEKAVGKEFLIDEENRLAAVGDWCLGNRAEDAFVSGCALAEHLERLLSGSQGLSSTLKSNLSE